MDGRERYEAAMRRPTRTATRHPAVPMEPGGSDLVVDGESNKTRPLSSPGMPKDDRDLPMPDVSASTMVASPETKGKGNWSGAPSAQRFGDSYYLAYRMRDRGERGHRVAIARSYDGVEFETLTVLSKEDFGAASLERPALVRRPDDGKWRLYVSCATPDSYHWWVEALDAADPSGFDPDRSRVVWPGDETTALKDPVVLLDGTMWHAWVCLHPLSDPEATDRMKSVYYTSHDGMDWRLHGTALEVSPGSWYQRGARIAHVMRRDERWVAYFDGRADAAQNAEEQTGIACGDGPDLLVPDGDAPVATSPEGSGSLRYLSLVDLGGDRFRLYYEASLADGSHALFTQLWAPSTPPGLGP
jgi:hypothetical protein